MGHEPQGTVRLTAVPDLATKVLADIVARFVRRYPKIHVELVLTSRSIDLIEEGIDIALRAGKLVDSSLVVRKILSTDLQLLASPAYLRRRGTPKSLRDLAAHDCIMYRPEAGKNTWRLTGPKGDESVEVTGSVGADDMSFLQRAAILGVGIALVPEFGVAPEIERGDLVRVLPDYAMGGGAVYLVSPAARHQLARVRLMREFLLAELPKAWRL
jgi:DNA-binding transcriptional LysR family regulator